MDRNPLSGGLAVISRAEQALAKAETPQEILDVRDLAEVARKLVKKKRVGEEAVFRAASVRIRSERKLGEFLKAQVLARAAAGNQYTGKLDRSCDVTGPISLQEIGLTKNESSQAQRIAAIPPAEFERFFQDCQEIGREPTMVDILRLARRCEHGPPAERTGTSERPFLPCLAALVADGEQFTTIYADPPWPPAENKQTAGKRMIERMMVEPVWRVAADDAHLHLWTPDIYLDEALGIMRAWQFEHVSELVWLTPSVRDARYWDGDKHYLLLGLRGQLPFHDRQPGYIKSQQPRKPRAEQIVGLIERVSAGPYLELCGTACSTRDDWRCCGELDWENDNAE